MVYDVCFVIVDLVLLRFNSVDLLLYIVTGGLVLFAVRVVWLIASYLVVMVVWLCFL